DHRRELTRENRDLFQLDAIGEERELQVALEARAALLLDLDRDVTHRPELADDELRVLGFERSLDELAALVLDLVLKCCGHGRSAVQESAEVFFVGAPLERDVGRDATALHELGKRHVHRDHAVATSGLEHRVDLMGLALTDEVADRRSSDHDLTRNCSTLTVESREE